MLVSYSGFPLRDYPIIGKAKSVAEPPIVPTQPRRQIEGFGAIRCVEQTAPYMLRRNSRLRERTQQKKKGYQQVKPAAFPQFARSVSPQNCTSTGQRFR